MIAATTFLWVRHGPTGVTGRHVGRTEVSAKLPEPARLGPLWDMLAEAGTFVSSPAARARQTAGALFPGEMIAVEARLQEQDFGEWEGRPHGETAMPEGLDAAGIAQFRPPGGESFAEVCARTGRAIAALAGDHAGNTIAIVAHAGPIRAALVHALASAPASGIAFEVAPLSVTRISLFAGGGARIDYVNRQVVDLPV
ncbi:MAG: histidine phosphatase family protein [Minwuia sp.]|uniref:histidine phosphatase family protein n=1 Tax=Minwuia sp. TaxID=2493630 RepID=UPI003A8352A1